MQKICALVSALLLLVSCNSGNKNQNKEDNKELSGLFEKYFTERMQLLPLESTQNGDSTNNDRLYADFTDTYRNKLSSFFARYLDELKKYNRDDLDANDQISYDIFKREMELTLEGLSIGYFGNTVLYPDNRFMPCNQFEGVPITLGQLGSGEGSQPFKTAGDYERWLARAAQFPAWVDSAIIYFRRGVDAGTVLPASLVTKMIPQMEAMIVSDAHSSLFYGPVKKFPATFTDADKKRFTDAYVHLINDQLVPAYRKLGTFLKDEYLATARHSTGIGALPDGAKYYDFLIRYWTTTNETPDQIYQTGLSEVKRIRAIMDSVKSAVGFKGDLNAFFEFMKNDPQFEPFKTPEDVLNGFRAIQARIEPHLHQLFTHRPKSPFEIRQTEAFRAASASAEYVPGSADGKRPGIFYVPILDAKTYNVTGGFESLFLHEAIPGHHYQISLQQENEKLPKFRRFAWYGAYGEGWALYCESLGQELGLYTDPYQYMGALGDEIHRAIRLVVDVGMHTKNMTREEAIKYMMENEAISEEGATAEIERYMAIPGQALSYKIGALKIRELRNKYAAEKGKGFDLAAFHDEFLKDGCMPLEVVEKKMDAWAAK
ncbi:MAG TPA: DUF885 domain-containing protein [Flavisolibacter sp.]|nr:DUF885 domain-containing protein [Flavisolibacter sp.]